VVTNRTGSAVVKGEILQLDVTLGQETANWLVGDVLSAYANVVTPATAFLGFGIFCIALEAAAADNDQLSVLFAGPVQALMGAVVTSGGGVCAVNAQIDLAGVAANSKVLGMVTGVDTTDSAVILYDIWFNGINGFGFQET
jgi:hypothetical protein